MSYLESTLQPGEQIVYKANLHFFFFVRPLILLLLGWWFWCSVNDVSHFLGGVSILLGGAFLIQRLLVKTGSVYAVTNKRVILKTGIISRRALDLVLTKCEGLQIKQSVCGRIFGFGTITVTTGGATNSYPFVEDPIRFKKEINTLIG